MKRFVVVSGLPASGKSTIARTLAAALSLPLLDKDEFLETLFDTEGTGDALWRRKLSISADKVFQGQALRSNGAILTSWWKHPRSAVESGTSTAWLSELPWPLVEIHCLCSPSVAAKRFMERERHPGHLDGRWTYADLVEIFEKQVLLGALNVAPTIQVSSEAEFQMSTVLPSIERIFAEAKRQPPR